MLTLFFRHFFIVLSSFFVCLKLTNYNNNSIIYEFEDPVPPTIDEEYLTLLEYVDYTTDEYNLCRTASIDVALSDTINIENTSCQQFTYKGSIVGYKIKVFYRDGTSGFYN